jgi:hypothetical protein
VSQKKDVFRANPSQIPFKIFIKKPIYSVSKTLHALSGNPFEIQLKSLSEKLSLL